MWTKGRKKAPGGPSENSIYHSISSSNDPKLTQQEEMVLDSCELSVEQINEFLRELQEEQEEQVKKVKAQRSVRQLGRPISLKHYAIPVNCPYCHEDYMINKSFWHHNFDCTAEGGPYYRRK